MLDQTPHPTHAVAPGSSRGVNRQELWELPREDRASICKYPQGHRIIQRYCGITIHSTSATNAPMERIAVVGDIRLDDYRASCPHHWLSRVGDVFGACLAIHPDGWSGLLRVGVSVLANTSFLSAFFVYRSYTMMRTPTQQGVDSAHDLCVGANANWHHCDSLECHQVQGTLPTRHPTKFSPMGWHSRLGLHHANEKDEA